MVTPEERQEIIDAAVEKALLMLPEVVGNLMAQHVALSKVNSEFYSKHPEFRDKKDIVASVLEQIDGKNPLMPYEELLAKAVPIIQERIRLTGTLNTTTTNPETSRDFNGAI